VSQRRSDVHVLTVNVPKEVHGILKRISGQHGKTMGALVTRLVFEHEARLEEREKLRLELASTGCTHLTANVA